MGTKVLQGPKLSIRLRIGYLSAALREKPPLVLNNGSYGTNHQHQSNQPAIVMRQVSEQDLDSLDPWVMSLVIL